jgi:IS5 family transposase
MKQTTFASAVWANKGKVTRRERFLAEMDAVIPWQKLERRIRRHYASAERGRERHPLATMLRIHCLQHFFNLSDPGAEEALYDSEAMRRFAGLELGEDAIPDESSILRFRHLLERYRLADQIFALVGEHLEAKGLMVKAGTIVDATLIAAPPSTKNRARARDPEMRQTRKGKDWHFGMKLHVGTDTNGTVHSLTATHAAVGDITQLPELLHGAEAVLYGDQAYWSEFHRDCAKAAGVRYRVNRRPGGSKTLTAVQKRLNRSRSRARARGEHAFRIVKHLWGFRKVRYRGLAKNLVRAKVAFALANLYALRRQLLPPQPRYAC